MRMVCYFITCVYEEPPKKRTTIKGSLKEAILECFWNVRNSRGRLFGEFRNVKMNGVRFLGTLEHRSTEPKVNLHMCVYGLTLSGKVGDVVSVCVLVRALASTE